MAIPLMKQIEGKYEILEKMGEGGMGSVYKVRHRVLEEIRVIKVMRQQLAADEKLRVRFLREAKTAIRLRHPNVAQLYDCTVDDDGNAYMVMEFIEGVTFEQILERIGPPPNRPRPRDGRAVAEGTGISAPQEGHPSRHRPGQPDALEERRR